jgi:hypothetical protein
LKTSQQGDFVSMLTAHTPKFSSSKFCHLLFLSSL